MHANRIIPEPKVSPVQTNLHLCKKVFAGDVRDVASGLRHEPLSVE